MEKKATSGIMLTLLLTSMLTLAFSIQPVKASETIYIMADGSVNPSNTPIQRDGDVYTFTADIYDSIVVEKDNIIVDGNGYTLQGTVDHGFLLSERSNVTIKNTRITGFSFGIGLYSSSDNTISNNVLTSNRWFGISIAGASIIRPSSNNMIINNTVTESACGIQFHGGGEYYNTIENNKIYTNVIGIQLSENAKYNIFLGNSVSNNDYGFMIMERPEDQENYGNKICHNNFVENTHQAVDNGTGNMWDDGYPSGGNYWSDYTGEDLYRGVYQNFDGSDGIGDTPYTIDANNIDSYPLMQPWTPVLISIEPQSIIGVPVGETFTINVNIFNVRNLYGWQFNLTFDPAILNVTEVIEGTFLKQVTRTIFLRKINNTAGFVLAMASFMPPYPPDGAYGDGPLASVTFKVKSFGQTILEFNKTMTYLGTVIQHWVLPIEHVTKGGYFRSMISCKVDINPDALNLRSKGLWITAYIQLPDGYNAEDIDATTILLNETTQPVLDPRYDFVTNSCEYLVDHNNDGILERMVKFDRAEVESFIRSQGIGWGKVPLTVTGELFDGTSFEGTDIIFVFYGGAGGRRK